MKQFGLGIIVAIGLTLPAFGQSADPLIGTWKFNPAKSTSTRPLAKSIIVTFAREGQSIVGTHNGVNAQGQAFTLVTQQIYDEMPHPTTGNPNYDSTTFTRVGNTVNAVRFKNGKVVEVAEFIINPGKTYSGHAEGVDANGQPYHFYLEYDRQ